MYDYDFVILGGRVVDGTGNPWFRADIGLRDGKMARIGQIINGEGEDI